MKIPKLSLNENYQKELFLLIIMSIFALVILFIYRNSIPPQVPLLFLVNDDENTLFSTNYLLVLPSFALVATLLNNFLVKMLQNSFFDKLVHYFNLCLIAAALYTLIKIILLVS